MLRRAVIAVRRRRAARRRAGRAPRRPGGVTCSLRQGLAHAVRLRGPDLGRSPRAADADALHAAGRARRTIPCGARSTAAGFGTWITAPRGFGRYLYDKTVQDLLAPASYRAVVDFRWRDAHGKVLHTSRATSAAAGSPTRGRTSRSSRCGSTRRRRPAGAATWPDRSTPAAATAGAFEIDFTRDGRADRHHRRSTAWRAGRRAHGVRHRRPPARPGEQIAATVDARGAVDESDEDDDTLSTMC